MHDRLTHYLRLRLTRQFVETFAVRVGLLGLSFANLVLTARLLGPEGRGVLVLGLTVVGLGVQLGSLGLPQANAYFVARDPRALSAVLGNSLAVSAVLGGLISAATFALLSWRPDVAPLPGLVLLLTLAWIPLQLWFTMLQSATLGLGRIRAYNGFDLWQRASITLAVGALFLVDKVGVGMVFACAFAAFLPGCLAAATLLGRACGERPRVSRPLLASSVDYAYKIWVGNVSGYLVVNADLFLVNVYLGRRDVGWYSVDGAIAAAIMFATQAMASVLFPTLAGVETFEERWRIARKGAAACGLIALVLCAAAALLMRPAVLLLLGPDYLPSVEPLLWLLPGVICYSMCSVVSAAHAASEHTFLMAVPAPLLAALNIGLNMLWIPRWNICGAAAASSVTYTAWLVTSLAYTAYYRRCHATVMDARRAAAKASPPMP